MQRLENAAGMLLIRHSFDAREAVLRLHPGRLEV